MIVTVNGQNINTSDEELIVSESVDIYECEFEFDASWDGWDKTAKFEGSGVTKEMILIDDKTSIPDEVIKEDGWMRVGVYGTRNAQVMPTIWGADVYVRHGTEPESTEITPTPSIYAQILAFVNSANDTAEAVQDAWEAVTASASTLPVGSSATVSFSDNNFAFGLPTGATGATGATGNGIQSIAKTGTSGLVDTYTITFTNGSTTTFAVTNGEKGDTGNTGATGNGISSITKTGTSGLVDTYTIAFTDGTSTTFTVTNGEDVNTADLAPAYSSSNTYAVGDYCIYSSQLYRCTTAITTAEAWTAAHWTAVTMGEDVSDLRSAFSDIIEVNQGWETADVTQTEISGYRIGTNGNAYEDASGCIICIPILSAGTYKVTSSSSSNLYMFVYNGLISNASDITSTNKVGVFGTVGAERSGVVGANQTICVTARSTTFTCTVDIYKVETSLNASFGLTTTMQTQVSRIAEGASSIANDALLYVDEIPTYYIDPTQTPATFAEAKPYLEEKISQIPSRNAMLFITDVHWFGNQKHSTYLMNYIRKRTGIENVLFGGDVYGNALNKYYAVKVLGEYLYQSRQAFYDNYIPCVGDHDNNTVNVDNLAEDHVPYSQLSELFIGDVKYNYKCYAPVEKVASMATGDDYNEIMDFFKTVYYVDNDRIKTRIIVLNCGNGGNYGALYTVFGTTGTDLLRTQIPFLIDSLYSTPSGYNVCILSHKLEYGGAAPNAIMSLLSGFKTKISRIKPSPSTSGNANIESFWAYNTSYDFSDAPDLGFVFSLNGHTHTDRIKWAGFVNGSISRGNTYDGVTVLNQNESGQIPYITTATDASANTEPDGPTMTNGTVTEQCFDVISILSDGLALTRFGAGDNRRIYMELNSN